jgi:hypothetical protein
MAYAAPAEQRWREISKPGTVMKTPQPKHPNQSTTWLRAVTSTPPTTVRAHAEQQRRKTITRRVIEDMREKREADLDRWS